MKRLYKITVSLLLIVTSLVYKPNLVIADDGTPGEITIDKTKDLGNNDIYEITLSVQGNPIVTTTPAPVDIVLVLDRSGSMSGTRMSSLKTAAKNFINTILDRNSDSRIAIVSFGREPSRDTDDFISHRATLIGKIDDLIATGGTHLEGGIREGYQMLEANTSSRPKSMVIMGDGEPTYGYDFDMVYSGPSTISGNRNCSVTVSNTNRNNDANYTGGRFTFDYTKRVGTGNTRTFSKEFTHTVPCPTGSRTASTDWTRSFDLADSVAHIAGWVKAKYDVYSIGLSVNNAGKTVLESTQNKGYWDASSSTLNNIFNLIAQEVTNHFPAGTEAVVTDEMGEHFTFEGFVPGYPGTASFNNANQTITWNLGEIKEATQVLKYKVKLKANAPAGVLDTNEEAWLNYKDPDGNPGDKEFPKPEVIAIRYEAKAGGSVSRALESMDETQGVAKGSTATPDPDFLFVKWTSDAAGNDSVSSNPNFTPAKVNGKNVPATYYAHFVRADDVTINYIANTGGSVDRGSETLAPVSGIAQGSTATPAPGYQFINWTSDAAGALAVGSALLFVPAKVGGVNVAATYYANFEPIDYTFTFDPNHGSEANVVETFQVGGSVTEANFSRIGFTFDGWTLDAAGNTSYTEGFTDLAPEDVYVYAQWKENADVTINYVANTGGNVSRGSETLAPATGVAQGSIASAAAGYDFVNWTTDAAGSNEISTDLHFVPAKVGGLNVGATYYANFAPRDDTAYRVEYYFKELGGTNYIIDNDETLHETGVTGTTVTAPVRTFTGFTENTSHTQAKPSGVIAGDGSLVLKRFYDRNIYTITYNIIGDHFAQNGYAVRSFEFGASVSPHAEPVQIGYVFSGWAGEPTVMPAENRVVIGAFTPSENTIWKVYHHLKDLGASTYTEEISARETHTGTTGDTTTAAARTDFTGFIAQPFSQSTIAADGSTIVDIYYNREVYTITYLAEAGGAINGDASQTVEHGGSTTEVLAQPDLGYRFVKWDEDGNDSANRHEEDVKADATYTALFEPRDDTAYRIEYWLRDLNASTYTLDAGKSKDLAGVTDTTANIPAESFEGFVEDEAHPDRLLSGVIAADGSLVLKRFYNRKQYTITYVAEAGGAIDGDASQTVEHGGSTTEVLAQPDLGYRFVKWDEDGNDSANRHEENVQADATYTALFEPRDDTAYRIEYWLRDLNASTYTLDAGKSKDMAGVTDATANIPAESFEGFTENEAHPERLLSGVIAADGSLVLKRFYDRRIYTITYNIIGDHFAQNGYAVRSFEFGASVSPHAEPVQIGYDFSGWAGEPTVMPAEDRVVIGAFTASENTMWQVRHHLKDLGASTYTELISAREIHAGTTGEVTNAVARDDLTGFIALPFSQFTIEADGSTIVNIYYDREVYTITYLAEAGGAINGDASQTVEHGGSTSEVIAQPDLGYRFVKWDEDGNDSANRHEEDVRADATYTALFEPRDDTAYRIEYWLRDLNASTYTLDAGKSKDLAGVTDATANIPAESFEGFIEDEAHPDRLLSGVIAADGSLVLKRFYDRKQYTITYIAEAGGSIDGDASQTVEHGGSTDEVLAKPDLGYRFVKWDEDGNDSANRHEEDVRADATYTALFEPRDDTAYRIEYWLRDLNASTYSLDSAHSGNLAGITGATANIPAESFEGFIEDETHSERLLSGVIAADGSLVLKRFYDRKQYTITYVAEAGGAIDGDASQTVEHGGSTTEVLAQPDLGYRFVKWDEDGNDSANRHEEDVRADATYTALFEPRDDTAYRIEYWLRDLNASTYTLDADKSKDMAGVTDTTANIPAESFEGFVEDEAHPERLLSGVIAADGSLVLKRFYDRKQYTVTYVAEAGGSIEGDASQTVEHGGSTTEVLAQPDLGYRFVKWDEDGNDSANRHEEDVRADATYTALFEPRDDTAYRIEYWLRDLNASTYTLDAGKSKDMAGVTDTTANIPAESFEGFIEDEAHPDRLLSGVIAADGSLVLKRFYDRVKHTVTYQVEANGEIIGEEVQEVEHGGDTESVTANPDPGYHFERWIEDDNDSPDRHETNVTEDAIFTARMVEDDDVTINYWANEGGAVSNASETLAPATGVAEGSEAAPDAGYVFVNWVDEEGNEVGIDPLFVPDKVEGLNVAADYYANFEAIDYTFTFDPNHGLEAVVVKGFNVGGSVSEELFDREGFTFEGWTTDADGEIPYDGGFDDLPAMDIYIYAQWEMIPEDEFVLTYVTNQPGLSIPSVTFKEGDALTPVIPSVEGFEFLGWFADEDLENEFDEFASMPARNVTVYAEWGEVLGDEDEPEIPDMSDTNNTKYGFILFFLGLLAVLFSKKEEEEVY